jgi:arylsulfatase A-like enzyme
VNLRLFPDKRIAGMLALIDQGVAKNTILVFMADNGIVRWLGFPDLLAMLCERTVAAVPAATTSRTQFPATAFRQDRAAPKVHEKVANPFCGG